MKIRTKPETKKQPITDEEDTDVESNTRMVDSFQNSLPCIQNQRNATLKQQCDLDARTKNAV
jgi:hypothetical protein